MPYQVAHKLLLHGCHRSGNSQGKKKFFKVREKSGNFTLSQGKFTSAVSVVFLYGQECELSMSR